MMKQVLRIITREWVLVLLLVIVGGMLRFANFPHTLFWTNDVARDMLVAWQIANLDLWPTVGHFNTGVQGYYQPYYFYFLGFLAKIGGAPDFLFACFIVLHTASLVGIYATAKNLFSRTAGFVALALSAIAGSLIDLAHFPTAAPWVWPLHILSLTLSSFWFTTKNKNYLWLAAAISFLAVQVHGAQLVLLIGILFLLARQKLKSQEWLGFFGVLVLLVVNQQKLIATLIMPIVASTTHFGLQGFLVVSRLFIEVGVMNRGFFYCFTSLIGLLLIWSLWQRKRIFAVHNSGWLYFGLYLIVFEVLLGLQKTGALPHHQYYVIPVVLILVSGWVVHLQLPVSGAKNTFLKFLLLFLLAGSVMVQSFAAVWSYGDFYLAQSFYEQLKQQNLPLHTASVLVTDNESSRLSDVSNSTQLWWFLATDLGRSDFNAASWSLGTIEREVILICNAKSAAAAAVSCDDVATAVLAKSQWKYTLLRTIIFPEQTEVRMYEGKDSR